MTTDHPTTQSCTPDPGQGLPGTTTTETGPAPVTCPGMAWSLNEATVRAMRQVMEIAQRFAGSGAPFLDLLWIGVGGLLAAVDDYDPSRDGAFDPYAAPLIEQAIRNALANRLPVQQAEPVEAE